MKKIVVKIHLAVKVPQFLMTLRKNPAKNRRITNP
jgi:hypothetical protein